MIGVLQMGVRYQETQRFVPSIWLFLGAIFAALYYIRRTEYTIFDTPKGRILVIRNATHDEIVREITTRRRKCMRERYATMDPDNSREDEARRFSWLHEHEIISDEEYSAAIEKLNSRFLRDAEEP